MYLFFWDLVGSSAPATAMSTRFMSPRTRSWKANVRRCESTVPRALSNRSRSFACTRVLLYEPMVLRAPNMPYSRGQQPWNDLRSVLSPVVAVAFFGPPPSLFGWNKISQTTYLKTIFNSSIKSFLNPGLWIWIRPIFFLLHTVCDSLEYPFLFQAFVSSRLGLDKSMELIMLVAHCIL